MIELQLVGYTADLKHLVFGDTGNGAARFKARVDDDLVATMREIVGLLGRDVGDLVSGFAPQPAEPAPAVSAAPDPVALHNGRRAPGEGALAAAAVAASAAGVVHAGDAAGNDQAEAAARTSKLSPREIQSLLRAGKTPKNVAKLAGTDEEWVQRWLPPIEAEREQVLQAVQHARLTKARLGRSKDLVGDAVRRNLAAKGLAADESVQWHAARKDGEAHWTVRLSYRSRGRLQRAVWRFDPETRVLEPRNALATEVGWTRNSAPGSSRSLRSPGAEGAGAPEEAPPEQHTKAGKPEAAAKSAVAKKAAAKPKQVAKKAAAKPKAGPTKAPRK